MVYRNTAIGNIFLGHICRKALPLYTYLIVVVSVLIEIGISRLLRLRGIVDVSAIGFQIHIRGILKVCSSV